MLGPVGDVFAIVVDPPSATEDIAQESRPIYGLDAQAGDLDPE